MTTQPSPTVAPGPCRMAGDALLAAYVPDPLGRRDWQGCSVVWDDAVLVAAAGDSCRQDELDAMLEFIQGEIGGPVGRPHRDGLTGLRCWLYC